MNALGRGHFLASNGAPYVKENKNFATTLPSQNLTAKIPERPAAEPEHVTIVRLRHAVPCKHNFKQSQRTRESLLRQYGKRNVTNNLRSAFAEQMQHTTPANLKHLTGSLVKDPRR